MIVRDAKQVACRPYAKESRPTTQCVAGLSARFSLSARSSTIPYIANPIQESGINKVTERLRGSLELEKAP